MPGALVVGEQESRLQVQMGGGEQGGEGFQGTTPHTSLEVRNDFSNFVLILALLSPKLCLAPLYLRASILLEVDPRKALTWTP